MIEIFSFNERADIARGPTKSSTIDFAVKQFLDVATKAIAERGSFHVALSGGSTPKAIFEKFTPEMLDWSKVHLYWSDERAVPPTDDDSNYKMAMDAGFASLPIPEKQIHRLCGEGDLAQEARRYEEMLKANLPEGRFDLVMLGMGDDGHTASLFPETHALTDTAEWVAANYIPQKGFWRLTLTYTSINRARSTVIYVLGKSKAEMVNTVLTGPYLPLKYPIQGVGTLARKPLWILDDAAGSLINHHQ